MVKVEDLVLLSEKEKEIKEFLRGEGYTEQQVRVFLEILLEINLNEIM